MPLYEIDTLGKALKKYSIVAIISLGVGLGTGAYLGYNHAKKNADELISSMLEKVVQYESNRPKEQSEVTPPVHQEKKQEVLRKLFE